jgi:hypothetical protein
MINAGLDQIIIIALQQMELDKAKLEVEESGREVAALQGEIAGIKDIISYISAEFHVTQAAIESTGDVPFTIPDLDENEFEVLRHDVEEDRKRRIKESEKAAREKRESLDFGDGNAAGENLDPLAEPSQEA